MHDGDKKPTRTTVCIICMNQSKLVSKTMQSSFSGFVNTERQNIKSRLSLRIGVVVAVLDTLVKLAKSRWSSLELVLNELINEELYILCLIGIQEERGWGMIYQLISISSTHRI